jgi:ribosomal protein L32
MERQVENIPMAQRPTIFTARQTQTHSQPTIPTAPVLEKSGVFHVKHTVFVGCPFGRYSGQKRTRYNSAHTSLSGSRSF